MAYIIVDGQSLELEGSENLRAAIQALASADLESARICCGDPDDPDSYATAYFLHLDGTRRKCA